MITKTISKDIIYKDELIGVVHLNRADINPTSIDIHVDIHKWSIEVYKEFLLVFGAIREGLKATPIEKVCTTIPQNDERKLKFLYMMGFPETTECTIMGHDVVYTEMEV
jgi:hypothetical protein